MDKAKIIADLNHLLSLEYAAYIGYQTTAAMLDGMIQIPVMTSNWIM